MRTARIEPARASPRDFTTAVFRLISMQIVGPSWHAATTNSLIKYGPRVFQRNLPGARLEAPSVDVPTLPKTPRTPTRLE
jgi:hypothetical protein